MSVLSVDIPILETERLILREPRLEDFEPLAEFLGSDRARFVGGPMDRSSVHRALFANIGHWFLRGYGFWYVTPKGSDAPVGRVGFIYADGWDEPELGWQVFAEAEAKGIAFEAASAAREHAARHQGLDGVISYINPANTRSIALAERLGATFEREGEVVGNPCHVYRHPRQRSA